MLIVSFTTTTAKSSPPIIDKNYEKATKSKNPRKTFKKRLDLSSNI